MECAICFNELLQEVETICCKSKCFCNTCLVRVDKCPNCRSADFRPDKSQLNLNCSRAAFSLLQRRDDNFAIHLLQYSYFPQETQLQTYMVIYNHLIQLGSNWFNQLSGLWKHQHRTIFELDGLFRTFVYFLERMDNVYALIDDQWKELARNMFTYVHSFWPESNGVNWKHLNRVLSECSALSKNQVVKTSKDGKHTCQMMEYSSDNGLSTFAVCV